MQNAIQRAKVILNLEVGAYDQRVQGYMGFKAPHLKTTGFRAKGKLLEMEELK